MNLFESALGASWKTTASGVVAAAGVAFVQSSDPWLHGIGLAMQIFGVAGLGTTAKDADVSHSIAPNGKPTNVAAVLSIAGQLMQQLSGAQQSTVSTVVTTPAATVAPDPQPKAQL